MKPTVACYWELPDALQATPFAIKKWAMLWTHTIKAFGVHNLVVIDQQGTAPTLGDAELTYHIVTCPTRLFELYPDHKVVHVETGGRDIRHYSHPDDALYVFGGNYDDRQPIFPGSDCIAIDSRRPMHAETALSVVLYDRMVKMNGFNGNLTSN